MAQRRWVVTSLIVFRVANFLARCQDADGGFAGKYALAQDIVDRGGVLQ